MTSDREPPIGLDEELTAYLDGALAAADRAALEARLADDAAARRRLALLRSGRPPAGPFDRLLDAAPVERLEAALAAAGKAVPPRRLASLGTLRAIAAAVVLLAGIGVGYVLARATAPEEAAETQSWRAVVADYVALYTPETFALAPTDPAAYGPRLAIVGEGLGLDLTPEAVALPGLDLRGAILFHYDGKPLGQVSYLSTTHGPVAFCIIRNGRPDAAPAFEERRGMNLVFWNRDGLGYLVIGGLSRDALGKIASALQARIS